MSETVGGTLMSDTRRVTSVLMRAGWLLVGTGEYALYVWLAWSIGSFRAIVLHPSYFSTAQICLLVVSPACLWCVWYWNSTIHWIDYVALLLPFVMNFACNYFLGNYSTKG